MSNVIVPLRGLGILPCGPSTRPRRPTTAIMSGVASATSQSVPPPCPRVARSSAPPHAGPARERDVEVGPALLHAGREIVRAHVVGAGLLGGARVLALGEDGDRLGAARAV